MKEIVFDRPFISFLLIPATKRNCVWLVELRIYKTVTLRKGVDLSLQRFEQVCDLNSAVAKRMT